MSDINISFIISLIIIGLGYAAKKTGIVKESDGEGIARIIFNFTLPAVVITAFSNITIDYSIMLLPLICIVFGLIMTLFALFIFRKRERRERGMMTMLAASFNIGLFAYPLVEMIWGGAGLKYFGMFDMGNAFIVFGSNYIIASVFSGEEAKIDFKKIIFKMLRSVPFIAYIITLTMTILHLSFPAFFLNITGIIAKANMPLCLLLLGIYLSFKFDLNTWKKMLQILLLRYAAGITAGIILFFLLPFDKMFKITILLGFSLPVSLAVVPYSVEFGYDGKFAGTVNNMTIVISFVIMWAGVFIIKAVGFI